LTKKEIKERENTIQDKVERIQQLKKKNQELEKFKFVLDYKITELKRQIKPRKKEMASMKEQINQMQKELKQYDRNSEKLTLEVRKLKLKYNGMDREIEQRIRDRNDVDQRIHRFKNDLHKVVMAVDDPVFKVLKVGVKKLYQRHVLQQEQDLARLLSGVSAETTNSDDKKGGDGKKGNKTSDDVHKDYKRQRHYLERSVDSLNIKLKKDMHVHKKENMRIMQENIALIKEINQLRREIQTMRTSLKQKEAQKRNNKKTQQQLTDKQEQRKLVEREIEMQYEQIRALKNHLQMLEQQTSFNAGSSDGQQNRPSSGQRLPPIESQ
jgi:chromosome segregation ATPase